MKRVLVVGDAFSDVYREFLFKKECPDAPGVNAYYQSSTEIRPGGAANVALNIDALGPGIAVDLIAAIDVDLARAIKVRSQFRVDLTMCVLTEPMKKERIFLDGKFVARLDTALRIPEYQIGLVLGKLRQYIREHTPDAIVISDYGAGVVSDEILESLKTNRDLCFVDTKLTDLSVFDGSAMIKLNRDEWERVSLQDPVPERFCRILVITQGGEGAKLLVHQKIDDKKSVTHALSVKAINVPVTDVCGCGDTFLAGLVVASLKNSDPFTALQFANAASATVVTLPRTEVADLKKTLALLGREEV